MDKKKINIAERMKHFNIAGLSISVLNNGQLDRVENYGLMEAGTSKEIDNQTMFHACSISKFLTAMLVLKLAEQGVFDLDEDVNQRLVTWKIPENSFTLNSKITLRNLLSHQSGMIDPEDSFMELNPNEVVPTMEELLRGKTRYCKLPINVKYVPESDFQYSDAGYCVIQQLIEDMLGNSFEEIVNEHIFQPLNMKNSTFSIDKIEDIEERLSSGHHQDGRVILGEYSTYPYPAACGLWTTTSDLSMIVLDLIHALRNESKLGISAKMAKQIISSQGCKEWMGLSVFLDDADKEIEISSLGWGKGFQCMMVSYPYLGNGLIIMTNTDSGVHQLKGIIGEIYKSYML